ncbi:malto-oligosyltrehalose synthase [Acidianus sp. HS-5]|uniref:malto-oligosyltrehalose synthase n=1 Tax=Acidianus sp. HS-5 TaxID=2886040 RepID=UPI001F02C5A7|nr:malto-oligosyltrehalose synthase [Acidianus sp. HS-5]
MSYRIQLNKHFNFSDLISILDYLQDLGVEWLYLSPILQARKGSTHGYDVYDFKKVSEDLGGEEKFKELCKEARKRGMKIIVDIVPNHMALENPYLLDFLKNPNSKYRKFFDFEGDKIILPILGEKSLEKVKIVEENGERFLDYQELKLPLEGEGKDLEELLKKQRYELVYWKKFDKINYRRFFDVNGLIGIRQEDEEVFNEYHEKIFELKDCIDGLRIDHIDGLLNPKRYLEELRERMRDKYIIVEKILSPSEKLRNWKIDGTTGYDFMRDVNLVFVNAKNEEKFKEIYEEFIGQKVNLNKEKVKAKIDVINQLFYGDVNRISRKIKEITGKDIKDSLVKFLSCLNVYRTYITEDEVDWEDIEEIKECTDNDILDLVNERKAMMVLQQLEDPIMAKGYEDTLFYRYNVLISLNEVGSDLKFGISCEEFHSRNIERELFWPNTMTDTSTHDTKFSEDVRARLNALSNFPEEWRNAVNEWSKINEKYKVNGFPTRNDEYRFYQTLLGTWNGYSKEYEERLVNYMIKAIREEKINTSWLNANQEYDNAVIDFVKNAIKDEEFLSSFTPFLKKINNIGSIYSIEQIILKLTSPGLPNIYQGNETLTYLMVDPDNRKKVNFEKIKDMLKEIKAEDPIKLFKEEKFHKLKLYVTWKLLNLRKERKDLFNGYHPLKVNGCGFERNGLITIITFYPFEDFEVKIKGKFVNLIDSSMHEEVIRKNELPFGVYVKQ